MRYATSCVMLVTMMFACAVGGAVASEWAEAVDVRGVVQIRTGDDRMLPLTVGMRLEGGETVITDDDGYARFNISGGSILDVFENSELLINEVLGEEDSEFSLSLFFGRLAMEVEDLKARDMVVAPTMVIGVRGTAFTVGVAEDGSSVVSVTEGAVTVSEEDAWAGQEMVVASGSEAVASGLDDSIDSRPSTMDDIEAWREYRAKRLATLVERLPAVVELAELRLERGLGRLDWFEDLVIEHAGELEAMLADMEPGAWVGPLERSRMRRHVLAVYIGLGGFRVVSNRMSGAYRRSMRLDAILSRMDENEVKPVAGARDSITRIMARREEAMARIEDGRERIRVAVEPIRPFLERVRSRIEEWRGDMPWQRDS